MTTAAKPSLARRIGLTVAMLTVTAVFGLFLAELLLRVIPIPGVAYHTFYYDEVTGGKLYPKTTLLFVDDHGKRIKRKVNDWGFLDIDHKEKPQTGTFRIGVYGDSYVEVRQVPIEQTFFRIAENLLNQRGSLRGITNRRGESVERVEVIAMGVSGRNTVCSYLESGQWTERLDLDHVVHVFVENDPGDNVPEVKRADVMPFPRLSGDSFVVDDRFNRLYGHKTKPVHRAWQYIKSNSLLVSTLHQRVHLLRQHGIKTEVTAEDRDGGDGGAPGRIGMAPSSWPSDSLVTAGWEVTERVIARWAQDLAAQQRGFTVIRVPRRNMLQVPLEGQDSWAPRLHGFADRSGLHLLDPTPVMKPAMDRGEVVFFNHFTPLGHELFAEYLATGLALHLAERSRHLVPQEP